MTKANVHANEISVIICFYVSSYIMDEYMILQDIDHLQNFSVEINRLIL